MKRKQTIKFFLKDGVEPRHQGKVYMVLILSNAAMWQFNPNCVQAIDDLVGDHVEIERCLERKMWRQRNAFLFRGDTYYLQRAVWRLERNERDVHFQMQNITMPSHEKLISLYAPIKHDQLYFLGDGSRESGRYFAGRLPMVFRTKDSRKAQCFVEGCRAEEVLDVWTGQTSGNGNYQTLIAKAYRRVAQRVSRRMEEDGLSVGFEAIKWQSFPELLQSYALYEK